jgi:hypothetical protein
VFNRFAYLVFGLSLLAVTACGDEGGSDKEKNGEEGEGTYAFEVRDQVIGETPDQVNVPSVETGSKDTWLVVHEQNDAGDAPGGVIGTSDVISANSEASEVAISLEREAKTGETLYAMLHYDDPEDGQFTFGQGDGQDLPIRVDEDGLTKSFEIKSEMHDGTYSLEVKTQEDLGTPGDVVIDSVKTGSKPAWIVIHEQNEAGDSFGKVIGNSELIEANSEKTDIAVQLDRDFEAGERLYAMLHYDDPADGEYTFGDTEGEDQPISQDGFVLVKSFGVTNKDSEDRTYLISVSDQSLESANEVTIDKVVVRFNDAFVAIREQNSTGRRLGSVVGHSSVISRGTSTKDMVVTVDRALKDGESLYAVLHKDFPTDGEFEWGPDGYNTRRDRPVRRNGSIISDYFTVSIENESGN